MSYDLRSALGWITTIAVVVSVATYLLSLFLGAAIITSTPLGSTIGTLTGPLVVEAFLLIFLIPVETNALWLVVLSVIVFVICFAKAATANGGFISGLRSLLPGSRPKTLPNWLAMMPIVGSSLFVVVLALALLQSSVGVSTGSLNCPSGVSQSTCDAELFASVVSAPVAEEIGFRITAIGLAIAILVAVKFGTDIAAGQNQPISRQVARFFIALIAPGYAKERSGLPSIRTSGLKGISVTEWVMLFFTSAVFGAYHILGGGGWGPGKFLTAALSGFALGIVYLAYGAFADILLHWFFNFYFIVFDDYSGLNGIFSSIGSPLIALGTLALGVWGIIIAIYWLSTWKTPATVQPSWGIPQYQQPAPFQLARDSMHRPEV